MKPWLALVLVACQRNEGPMPAPAPEPAPLNVQLVGCAPAGERPRVARKLRADDRDDADAVPMLPSGWFPYATHGETDEVIGAPLAKAAAAALADKLVDLDLCLTGKTGSVSIMLEVGKDGAIAPRVGGIGHRPTEQCIANVAKQLKLAPATQPVELECGLSAGAAGPFRIGLDGGYRVIEVTAEGFTLDGAVHEIGAGPMKEPPPNFVETVLVVADPDIPSTALASLLHWLSDAPAVLVAVRADGGPPVFVAMAPDRWKGSIKEPRLGVHVSGDQLQACAGEQRGMASLLEPKRVDAMLGSALASCGDQCDDVIEVGLGTRHTAKQLVGATSAVRRAGRDPVLSLVPRCPGD
jgi:hypothetical protein